MELHLKQCSVLTNNKCGTILIEDSIMAGLSRYQNIWNMNFSFNTLNCSLGGDKVLIIFDELAIYLLWKECEMLQSCVVRINFIWMHLKILVIVSSRVGRLLKGPTLMLIFLFVNFTPWLLLVDKPSLYKRC